MPVPLLEQYADTTELKVYWRALSDAEVTRADDLLTRAATLINEQPSADRFILTACNAVSLDMVKRAMLGGSGVTQAQQAMADMSASVTYVNPVGNLYLTKQELGRLAGFPQGSSFSVAPKSNTRVPHDVWNYQLSRQCTSPAPTVGPCDPPCP